MPKNNKKNTKKKDVSDTTLRDPAALKFWNKNFQDQDVVTNEQFAAAAGPYVMKKKLFNKEEDAMNFVNKVTEKFLCIVDPSKYPGKIPAENFVDTHSVQFAINVFGPWIQMFQFILDNFWENIYSALPIKMFHGNISDEETKTRLIKGNEYKSAKKKRFLLRLKKNEQGNCVLVLSGIRLSRGKKIIYENWEAIRFKCKPKVLCRYEEGYGINPPEWHVTERIPTTHGCLKSTEKFRKLGDFVHFLENKSEKIKTAVWAQQSAEAAFQNVVSSEPPTEVEAPQPQFVYDDASETHESQLSSEEDEHPQARQHWPYNKSKYI